MKKVYALILALLTVFTLTACNGGSENENVVYVTVYPMEYLVQQIVGEEVAVKRVPGTTNHGDYVEWSAKEIIDMKSADLLFFLRGGADDYVPKNEETLGDGDVTLIDMSQHIEYNKICYDHVHDDEGETTTNTGCEQTALTDDPHFWLDPVLMAQAAEFIKDKLIVTYPEKQELFENNYTVLNTLLLQLNTDYELMAAEATKPIITTAMLFTYWTVRYDIEILSIATSAHSSEVIPGDIIDFVDHAVEDNIEYILFEKNANSPAGEQVLDELKEYNPDASELYLHGLGSISQDELDNSSNYLTIMYENLEVLKSATK